MKINFPLLALAVGAFGIGTTEFSPMGLLPTIAKGVDVSIPMAGMLISAYAVGVMVGAPLMTLLLSHRARRSALIFLMAIFTLGNVLSAIAPDYTTLMLSRIITSLNHGAFFGLGSVVAASVVPKEKRGVAERRHRRLRHRLAVSVCRAFLGGTKTGVYGRRDGPDHRPAVRAGGSLLPGRRAARTAAEHRNALGQSAQREGMRWC